MKRLFVFGALILSLGSLSLAVPGVWTSSTTLTVETTQNLCPQTNIVRQAILHGVCVSSATATAGSSVIIYASSASAINPIANIDTMAKGCYYYDVYSSTSPGGLTYSTIGPGASVQIMYECY